MSAAQYIRSYERLERVISDPQEPLTNRIRAIGDMLSSALRDNLRKDLIHLRQCLLMEAGE